MISAGTAFAANEDAAAPDDSEFATDVPEAVSPATTTDRPSIEPQSPVTDELANGTDLKATKIGADDGVVFEHPSVIEGNAIYYMSLYTDSTIPLPISNKTIDIEFQGATFNSTTNILGIASFKLPDAPADEYDVKMTFAGDEKYAASSLTTTIEIKDVQTQIIALENASYPRALTIENLSYYPIYLATNTTIPLPVANKTVIINFNGKEEEYNTSALGIINYIIPYENMEGDYNLTATFPDDLEAGYYGTTFETTVELYDLETEVIALNASYPRALVAENFGVYTIELLFDIDVLNITIPLPAGNKTVQVTGDLGEMELPTNGLGLANFTIANDTASGNYTINVWFDGTDGYKPTEPKTVTIEVYDVPTTIYALENVVYPHPLVDAGLAYYPIALIAEVNINGTAIPIPLSNTTVTVEFNGKKQDYNTSELGIINYYIPDPDEPGNFTLNIAYAGDDAHGILPSNFTANVEIYDVHTKIFALEDTSYPRPVVAMGHGHFPAVLTADESFPLDINYTLVITENWTIPIVINTTIPIYIPLGNQTVSVSVDGKAANYTTEYGLINFTLPTDLAAGNHTVNITYAGAEGFYGSDFSTTVEVYDVPTTIYALENVAYPHPLVDAGYAYYPIALIGEAYITVNGNKYTIPVPAGNQTITVDFGGVVEEVTTNALGIANYTLSHLKGAGNYTMTITYAGDEELGILPSNFTTNVEIYDVDTKIYALDNVTYPHPLVAEDYGYYPIALTTDVTIPIDINWTIDIPGLDPIDIVINTTIPINIPLANRTVSVQFDGSVDIDNLTTDENGIVWYILPNHVEGTHEVRVVYAGEEGYNNATFIGSVKYEDVETQFITLGNASYPRALVAEGYGYYPVILTTNISIPLDIDYVLNISCLNISIPIKINTTIPVDLPIANQTVTIGFNGVGGDFTTNAAGLVNFILDDDATAGNYTVKMTYPGNDEKGYKATELITNVEIYDITTQFIMADEVTFDAAKVTSNNAIVPIFLVTNTTIPLPLGNKTVLVEFEGGVSRLTTNILGMVTYVIPPGMATGNYTLIATFEGTDGYAATNATCNVEIIGINTEIIAPANVTVKITDLNSTDFNLTLVDENGNVLAGQTIEVEFNGVFTNYVTDANGTVTYKLSDAPAGENLVTMYFRGADNYTASYAMTKVNVIGKPTKIFLRNALYFVMENKIVRVTLWDGNNKPLANKTVHISLPDYGLKYSGVTDENGTAYIRVGVGFGVHNATVSFDGDDEYAASNRSGFIRVIKETPSIMVRGNNQKFKVNENKIVNVYLWDRTSKPLPVGSKVGIKINGVTYIGYTDSQGIASIQININKAGTYNAELLYGGNSAYNAVKRPIKFVIQ